MSYDRLDIPTADWQHSLETVALIAGFTVISGIALTTFLFAVTYTVVAGQWLLTTGLLAGTGSILVLYYRGIETIFTEFHHTRR